MNHSIGSDYSRAVQRELIRLMAEREAKHGPQPFGGREHFELVDQAHANVEARVKAEAGVAA